MSYQLYSGPCGFIVNDDLKFNFDRTNKLITVDTSTGFEQEEICLRATSIGKVTMDQTMNIEVCGDEVITLNKEDQISMVYERSSSGQRTILISSLGYIFSSNRENCPASKYKVFEDLKEYLGTDLILSGSSLSNNLALIIQTS